MPLQLPQNRRVPSLQRPQWPTAICRFQQCRVSRSTALVAMNPLCGGKLDRLFPRSSHCGGKNASQGALAFPFHFVVGTRARSPTVAASDLFLRNTRGMLSARFAMKNGRGGERRFGAAYRIKWRRMARIADVSIIILAVRPRPTNSFH